MQIGPHNIYAVDSDLVIFESFNFQALVLFVLPMSYEMY